MVKFGRMIAAGQHWAAGEHPDRTIVIIGRVDGASDDCWTVRIPSTGARMMKTTDEVLTGYVLLDGSRDDVVRGVLTDAAQRDESAEARDARADEREAAASLDAFLHPDDDRFDAELKARRSSALDRADAKSDRAAAAEDRSKLSVDPS